MIKKKEKKIIIEMDGRLGNQIFLYSFYYTLKKQYPHLKFKVDVSNIWNTKFDRGVELLYVFPNLKMEIADKKEIWKYGKKITFSYRGKGSRLLRKTVEFINSVNRRIFNKIYLSEEKYIQNSCEINIENTSCIVGFWQNFDLYSNTLEYIKKDLVFRPLDLKNNEILNDIRENMSVSVHIRRGDFVGEIIDILTPEYFKKIINKIDQEYSNVKYFFFSDDTDYIDRNFAEINKVVVKGNIGKDSYQDMVLMSECRINIVSNSTFSIWAGVLNKNLEKKVYYPNMMSRIKKTEKINLPGFYMENVDL